MSFEEELKAQKERLLKEKNDKEMEVLNKKLEEQYKERVDTELRNSGMFRSSKIPEQDPRLVSLVNDMFSSLVFDTNNVMKTLNADGCIYVKRIEPSASSYQRKEINVRSYDLQYKYTRGGKASKPREYYFTVLDNGKYLFRYFEIYTGKDEYPYFPEITVDFIAKLKQQILNDLANREINPKVTETTEKKSGGCYIATAVYGSYDCPEVWILRRYRDFYLMNNSFGRMFVKLYYKVSPTLVKMFGNTKIFNYVFKAFLDKKIELLKEKGYSDNRYND